jgi:hypothetical protein
MRKGSGPAMSRACNNHVGSVWQEKRPAQRSIADHHPSSGARQPARGMAIRIGLRTGVETASVQLSVLCWSPSVSGFDTGCLPPPPPPPLGWADSLDRAREPASLIPWPGSSSRWGRRADLIRQPAASPVEWLSLCTRGCHPAKPIWHLFRHDCHLPTQGPTELQPRYFPGHELSARVQLSAEFVSGSAYSPRPVNAGIASHAPFRDADAVA